MTKRIEDKVIGVNVEENELGKYIPYCMYPQHHGVIGKNRYKFCVEYKCPYLIRFCEITPEQQIKLFVEEGGEKHGESKLE